MYKRVHKEIQCYDRHLAPYVNFVYYLYMVIFGKGSIFDGGFKLAIHSIFYTCEHGEDWKSMTGSLQISYAFPYIICMQLCLKIRNLIVAG